MILRQAGTPPAGDDPQMTMAAFLASPDLDELAELRSALDQPAAYGIITQACIAAWTDRQGVANLLMYPDLIPAEARLPAILRGLASGGDGYLQLAATVGVGRLVVEEMADGQQDSLIEALLDLVAADSGPAAVRAAAELGRLMRPEQLPELVVLLPHPAPEVRHNLTGALARLLGGASIAELLEDRYLVTAADARAAVDTLARDGVDIHDAASDLRLLPVLPHLPDLDSWWPDQAEFPT